MNWYDSFLQTFSLDPIDAKMIVVMAVVFAVFWKVLMERAVFRPQMGLLDDREAATGGLRIKALRVSSEADALREKYENRLNQVRTEVLSWKESELGVARLEAAEIVRVAEAEAEGLLNKSRSETAQFVSEAKANAQGKAAELAASVAQSVTSALQVH